MAFDDHLDDTGNLTNDGNKSTYVYTSFSWLSKDLINIHVVTSVTTILQQAISIVNKQ